MNKRQSLFHIAKRDTLPWYQAVLIRGGAIVLALIVCAIVTTLLTGENPLNVYSTILYGAFGTPRKSWVTFHNLAILLGISLAVTPAFKMRFWNIGAEAGGRLTSNFGKRKAPKKGASTYHKGVDWATPKGTTVVASCGGTVAKAGWGSGYGYVVYINHEDGRQTRYGHLSKVLVTAGQKVSQGDKIALSGNTGVSTGPHLHFEILINGKQVNPLNYLN